MSQQYENLPPPPPPRSPGTGVPGGSSPEGRRSVPGRPLSITTNIARTLAVPSQTPSTATALSPSGPRPYHPHPYSPNTSSSLNPSPRSVVQPGSQGASPRPSIMESYNPRQWNQRQVSGSQMIFNQRGSVTMREASGMEAAALPSPPPPYSPETRGNTGSAARGSPLLVNTAFTASPLNIQGDNSVPQSPQVPMSPSFPPPPAHSSGHRERSTSGIASRGFFNLSGLRTKQPIQTEFRLSSTVHVPEYVEPQPPAARRAASTGQIHSSSEVVALSRDPSLSNGRSSPENQWQPGMPLPGPPPGPPPPGARSQSLNRYPTSSSSSNSLASEYSVEAPRYRRAAASTSNLGPIPPTPADWVDLDAIRQQHSRSQPQETTEAPSPAYHPLRIDTGSSNEPSLSRRPAKRDSRHEGLRERRSRSRAGKDHNDFASPQSDEGKLDDLVLPTTEGSISRRREHVRTVSGYVEPKTDGSSGSSGHGRGVSQSELTSITNVLTPPYTPAIGNKSSEDLSKRLPFKVPNSTTSDRPISHLLHQPVENPPTMPAPLTPSRPPSSGSAKPSAKLDAFYTQALERHRAFIEKEATATSDEERLELFANFMVHESRLRRDRYHTAYNVMASDILDLTRDMWRSYTRQSRRAATPSTSLSSFDPTVPSWASDGQPVSAHGNGPSSASSFGDFTPATDAGSMLELGEGIERSDSRQWGEAFKPSLSPIPSMAVSTVPDESSSRGRTASRWWEHSNSGSGSIGKPDRIQKTLRETKYMGIDPASLQESNIPSTESSYHTGSTPGPSTQSFGYALNEYPPEKVGWHESADQETPMATPAKVRKISTSGVEPLDVSRLVTLPPPYPRHHPALNNKHPLLSSLRSEHRALISNSKIREIKEAYLDEDFAIQRQQQEAAKERRTQLRANVQEKIAGGSITFAQAAQAEADFDAEEAERGKADARSNFDVFEASVAHPLNGLLTEGLQKANACISHLRAELETHNQLPDPNQAQEEGDEQPERLEKLTLLKWLFEAREQLHKEMFDLHADRSAKYSEVILTPYRIGHMQAKIDEATSFFSRDDRERQATFARESLKRFEELRGVMEANVSRGVEDQLSAFWDIAPGLLEVIQQVPANVNQLDVQIPEQEYAENPAYNDHPLQYLYSLLSHAQRSAYQFIENQTNLLCLLHEVRTATTKSSLRLLEIERNGASPNDETLRAEMQQARHIEEGRLTEDLKEKVGEVERQWQEALGDGLAECRGRVKGFLEATGGWEEGLEG